MRMVGLKRWVMVFLVLGSLPGFSQDVGIDTVAIKALLHEWNFANNTRSAETFRNLYADRILFYTQDLSEAQAVALKEKMFAEKPGFKQTLEANIEFSLYTSGVVKCDFVKEVWERSRWKSYPSYLLISYQDNQYLVVGESDYPTDETLGFSLSLGEEMDFYPLAADTAANDAPVTSMNGAAQQIDSLRKALSENFDTLLSSLPEGLIIVSKRDAYLLIGLLAFGGLAIFVADSVHSSRRRRRKPRKVGRRIKADDFVSRLNNQAVFEAFVVTLFDPMFFRHKRPEAEKVYAGSVPEQQQRADLEIIYHNQETTSTFAVKCLYLPKPEDRRSEILGKGQVQMMKTYEAENDIDVYYVIGIGGTPDDPKEVYLVPSRDWKGGSITYDRLRPFVKSGMIYYHRRTRKLR